MRLRPNKQSSDIAEPITDHTSPGPPGSPAHTDVGIDRGASRTCRPDQPTSPWFLWARRHAKPQRTRGATWARWPAGTPRTCPRLLRLG
jgi:hypothetical protein